MRVNFSIIFKKPKMSKTKYYSFFLLLFSILFSCTVNNGNSESILRIWYANKSVQSDGNTFTIDLLDSDDITDVQFTLEVKEKGYTLRDGNNNDLPLDKNNQYVTNMDFSGGKQHVFKVIAQDGNISVYTIRAEMGSENTFSFQKIIEAGTIPSDLANYDDMSKGIFSHYTAGVMVVARYIKETVSGSGDGSSWGNAANDIQAMIDGINDANADKIYVVLVASGTYSPSSNYVMKNHIALVGGFIADSYDRLRETRLDGNNNQQIFNNDNNGLNSTALLYGVVITNGKGTYGGGMYNNHSSPVLINVTFSGNTADYGGGMFNNNNNASPTLINVTFSGNTADIYGGGMHNDNSSSPTLNNVYFSDNEADNHGGGIFNNNNASPTLINVTFSRNMVTGTGNGGGIANNNSSPTLINVTFSRNMVTGTGNGGGIANDNSSPTLINVTLSHNMVTGTGNGGGIYHDGNGQSLTLMNMILSGNNAGNIYLNNDNANTETVNLYYSRNFGGVNASTTASGIRLRNADTSTYPIAINSKEIITEDPGLGTLANYGGEINTVSIGSSSPAKDKGVYVRGVKAGNTYPEANLYYSTNNTDWYSDPDLTTQESPPNNADDLTATDARGYGRVGRPDMGAYEAGGIEP